MIKRLLQLLTPKPKPVVDWGFSCGRTYLTVNGYVVAMEGDVLRDLDLGVKMRELAKKEYPNMDAVLTAYFSRDCWTGELIKFVAAEANGGVLPR